MPGNRFSAEALEPFVEEALAEEAIDPMAVSFEAPAALERKPTFRKYGLPALAGGSALDILSTYYALGQGGREANPVLNGMGRGTMALTNGAISAAMALLLDRVAKRNPDVDKLATIGGVLAGGVRGGIGVNNLRVANQMRDR